MFLGDKYFPKSLKDMYFHLSILKQLAHISIDSCAPSIIFSGTESVGKKTLTNMYLEMVYDSSVHTITEETFTINKVGATDKTKKSGHISKSKQMQVTVKRSNYHIIIEPTRNNSDKTIIQGIIKKYSFCKPLNVSNVQRVFKTVVILNADELTLSTQAFLRRTMEKYTKTCRYVLCCRNLSKIIKPIQSRCYKIAVPKPARKEMLSFIFDISIKENIKIGYKQLDKILNMADGNIDKGINLLELYQHKITNMKTSYDELVDKTVDLLLEKKITTNYPTIKNNLYHMMITNFACPVILHDIVDAMLEKIKSKNSKVRIIKQAAKNMHNLCSCRRPIYHLLDFCLNI